MDIVALAEQIAQQHVRRLDPTDGVVEEAAAEYPDKTWAIILRPDGVWVYLIGYLAEQGWALVRIERAKLDTPTTAADFETLGVHQTRVQALALASSLLEGQP